MGLRGAWTAQAPLESWIPTPSALLQLKGSVGYKVNPLTSSLFSAVLFLNCRINTSQYAGRIPQVARQAKYPTLPWEWGENRIRWWTGNIFLLYAMNTEALRALRPDADKWLTSFPGERKNQGSERAGVKKRDCWEMPGGPSRADPPQSERAGKNEGDSLTTWNQDEKLKLCKIHNLFRIKVKLSVWK